MKQKFFIFAGLILLVVVLIGLNAASYVQKEKTPDSEFAPNRSTFNAGATGTRALYELLAETGRRPARWQEPMSALLINDKNKPQTFVVIGRPRREFDATEIEQLLRWVSGGGRLVIIDREPPADLIKATGGWKISADAASEPPFINFDPSNVNQMTEKIVAAKPTQPAVYTNKVIAVQSSRFASSIVIEHPNDKSAPPKPVNLKNSNANLKAGSGEEDEDDDVPPPPAPPREASPKKNQSAPSNGIATRIGGTASVVQTPALAAPIALLANNDKILLADFPHGAGQIVFLSDPFIVSNSGINLVDNAQLAVNIIASGDGIVAFDEFHQGFGAGQNRLLNYFEGTPMVAVFLQIVALIIFVLFAQSRRFARALPEREPNRLSKLEYVAAMAELQQRTRAFDLAIENIYTDFRRRAARLVGADNFTVARTDLARMIAERGKLDEAEIEQLMFKCEDITHGAPTDKREVLDLTARLRAVEARLGLQRQKRK